MGQVRLFRALLLCSLFLISARFSFAQSDTAAISGYVRDATGAVVTNATVAIRNEATSAERRTTSNETGYYTVPNLPSGVYTVRVEAPGFKRFEQTQTKLDASVATTVDANLQVGQASETVEVVANAVTIQSESATLGKLITTDQIQNMQLNGRNPLFLAMLKPGVRRGDSLAGLSFGLDSGGFSINGSRSQENLITFDGAVAVRTRSNGTSVGVADADAVSEIQVLTANYNAEYGRSSGGQIRMITRSGTRDFHGSAYEFFRNSELNANSWARNRNTTDTSISGAPPAERYNQFGYNVSGPIFIPKVFNKDRNKLFFLFSQEWVKRRRADTTARTVPTLLMRNGDFSELQNPSSPFFVAGAAGEVRDPTTNVAFPGNIIPASQRSPNGLALLRAYPLPTGFVQGIVNYTQQRPTTVDQRKETGALDLNLNEKNFFRFRVQNYNFAEVSAFRDGTDRAPQVIDRPNRTGSLSWTYAANPTTVNEFLATASVDRVYIAVDTSLNTYQRSQYGINYPYIFPERKEIFDKIPSVQIAGPFTVLDGGPYPAQSTGPIYNASNNTTKILNNHTLKFGVSFERSGQNDFDQINVSGVPGGTNNQNGRFEFANVQNVALGRFNNYSEIGARSFTPYRGHMMEWFVQDSWKVTPQLRLEYGIRHSIIQPFYSLWRNMDVFDPTYYDPARAVQINPANGYVIPGSGDRYNGIVIPGEGFTEAAQGRVAAADTTEFNRLFRGVDKAYSKTHKTNFQPRFGIAYSWNNKTVVRAGGGRFITRLGVSDSVFLGGNPPFQPIVSVSGGSVDNPGGGSANLFPFNFTSQDPTFPNPEAYTWNFTVERELFGDTALEVSYVGRRGLHLQRERDINQPVAGTVQANPGVNINALRPYKGFSNIRVTNNDASSMYNGLQLGLTRRLSKGLSYGVSYTYSKSLDSGSSSRDVIPNSYDASTMWGPSSYDNRHVAVVNFIYQLPVFTDVSTLTGKLLGGWQITGVSQFQTGRPYTIGSAQDIAGVGGTGNIDGNPTANTRTIQMWNVNGDFVLPNSDRAFANTSGEPNYYFRVRNADGSNIFVPPAAGTFSTQRNRNIVYGPGFQNWNLGLFKNFYITERQYFTFRAEAFNWLNHPNWGASTNETVDINPANYLTTFGKVTSKNSERNLQLSLRFSF